MGSCGWVLIREVVCSVLNLRKMRLAVTSEQNGLERDQTESQECGALVNIKFCKEVEKETN